MILSLFPFKLKEFKKKNKLLFLRLTWHALFCALIRIMTLIINLYMFIDIIINYFLLKWVF